MRKKKPTHLDTTNEEEMLARDRRSPDCHVSEAAFRRGFQHALQALVHLAEDVFGGQVSAEQLISWRNLAGRMRYSRELYLRYLDDFAGKIDGTYRRSNRTHWLPNDEPADEVPLQ